MGELFGGYTYDPSRWQTWTTTTGGSLTPETYTIHHDGVTIRRGEPFVYDIPGDYGTVDIPSMWPRITEDEWKKKIKLELDKEDESGVSVRKLETHVAGERAVVCDDWKDLTVEHILTTLSVVKGRLMLELSPKRVKKLECSITPAVKQNIITASKKLKMYGKEIPIIPHFDEWGTRLPDEIKIGDHSGITLKIVNPEEFGEFYYELRATVFPSDESYYDPFDVPF